MNLKMVIAGAVMALGLALGPAEANADVTYTYTGAAFTTEAGWTGANNVTGSMVLSAALGANLSLASVTPVSFSFTDGTDTITNNNETSTIFKFSTNAAGNITDWGNIYAIDISHYIQSTVQGDGVVSGAAHQAFNRIPGSWSGAVAAVPEPATWTMMLAGFGGLGAALRSKRRRAVAD